MRVAQNLNLALHGAFEADPDLLLLGEDVADPYGGAFKITMGLSSRFPGRVLATPISEGGLVGVAAGLALAGMPAIAEIMFADFLLLAFDQLVNFAAKSVSMYGRRVPLPLLVRCPTGAGRGYGPTHSQCVQKHCVGVPGLSLYEVSPFHDNRVLLANVLARGEPAVLFEDKVLYTRPMFADGQVDDLFSYDVGEGDFAAARVFLDDPDSVDCVLITPGGMAYRALRAMRTLLLEREISCLLLVPPRLYPLDVRPFRKTLGRARAVFVAEDGTPGGGWGTEVAQQIHSRLWGELKRPVTLITAADSVVPAAAHLERRVLVQDTTIHRTVAEVIDA